MNLNTSLVLKLQKLIGLEPDLFQELKKEKSMEQLVERTVAAAERHGIAISSDQLAALLATVNTNMAKGEISDEALEGVAGGLDLLEIFERISTIKYEVTRR